jgi:hypothetical protein
MTEADGEDILGAADRDVVWKEVLWMAEPLRTTWL